MIYIMETETGSNARHGSPDDTQTHSKVEGGGAQISIGRATNIMVGNYSKMVISSKSGSKSKSKRKSSHEKKIIPCQSPITNSTLSLTIDQKMEIRDRVGRQWKDLGRRLGIPEPELEQLEMENANNHAELNYQILLRWEQRMANEATCEAIAIIFQKMGRGDLADILSNSVVPS